MSRNQHNKYRVTKQQEIFLQALIEGYSQRKAYLIAYPSTENWKETSLDAEASKLYNRPLIKQRYTALLQEIRAVETAKTLWTREQSVQTLRYVIEVNKKDLKRITNAYEQELTILQEMMIKDPEKAPEYLKRMINQRKSKRASHVNNKGITDAVSELNKMQGFNEETINLNGMVSFEGEEELED